MRCASCQAHALDHSISVRLHIAERSVLAVPTHRHFQTPAISLQNAGRVPVACLHVFMVRHALPHVLHQAVHLSDGDAQVVLVHGSWGTPMQGQVRLEDRRRTMSQG